MTTTVMSDGHSAPRVGLIGGGFMAEVHSRAARLAPATLRGLASSSADRALAAAGRLGIDTAYASAEELIADPQVDVVHICTPNTTHAGYAAAALLAGKHVICEKPLAITAAEAQSLAELARTSGRIAAVPFIYRYHPMVREARARVREGRIGELFSLSGAYLQDWMLRAEDDDWRVDPRQGGPSRAFADIGSHLVDLIEFVTGERIVRLAARIRTVHADRAEHRAVATEDLAVVLVELESGALGTLLVSQAAAGHKNGLRFELHGADAAIAFDQEKPDELRIGSLEATSVIARDAARLGPDAARLSRVPSGHPMGYQEAFAAFVADVYAAVAGESPDGLPTFDDGLRAAVITESVLRSAAADGGWVEVPVATVDAATPTAASLTGAQR